MSDFHRGTRRFDDVEAASFSLDDTDLTVTEDGGDRVAKDTAGNVVLRYDEAARDWVMGSLNTDDQIINDSLVYGSHNIAAILEAESSGLRIERGEIQHNDPGNAGDGTWETFQIDDQTVTFTTAFSDPPRVLTDVSTGASGYEAREFNVSTTAFTSRLRYYRTSRSSSKKIGYFAIGGD